ncbi:MAG: hypothetical protein A2286_08710 [Gammaproteobacteria bacterium RIFOXYA12_FULL_61_12]|nr:MAG: hypothetical protein A2514_15440 [Gammaproteobacteria bacterium RIFOXYD12_FULL_61_37]OGT93958.1 MAG: hypothetical protein A2286_08710 [Gammaproteobacteria bacterium RIFOXYA12_FULL_61_12]
MASVIGAGIYTNYLADHYGRLQANPDSPNKKGTNDQYDAYRHALVSAKLAEWFGEDYSKKQMEQHEIDVKGEPKESSMDRWNNRVGLEEYSRWKKATELR